MIHQSEAEDNISVTNVTGRVADPANTVRRLSDAETAKLIEDYGAGASLATLGRQRDMSRQTVSKILKSHGVTVRYRRLTLKQVDEAARLYERGWSLARIGERMDVDPTTVHNRLRERGVRMRDTQGQKRAN